MRQQFSCQIRNLMVSLTVLSVFPLLMSTATQAAGTSSAAKPSAPAPRPAASQPASRPVAAPVQPAPPKPVSPNLTSPKPTAPATSAPKPAAPKPAAPKPAAPKPAAPKPAQSKPPANAKPAPAAPKPAQPAPAKPHPEKITRAVAAVNPNQSKYQPKDITGDGVKETFCNWFVMDVAKQLGHPNAIPSNGQFRPANDWGKGVPKPIAANQMRPYFQKSSDWKLVTPSEAAKLANDGGLVVGSYQSNRGHGHVAVVVPGSTGSNIRVAQAGSQTSTNMAPPVPFQYYAYTGK
jgi:outer membrane biosynthesis protein TonB